VRLAPPLFEAGVRRSCAQCGHRFEQTREEASRLEALLDDLLPPLLRILVPGGAGERFQRMRAASLAADP